MAEADAYTLCQGVFHFEVEDGTSRLLNLGGRFYALSTTATQMLRATLDRGTRSATEELAREFQVPAERIRADLTAMLADLRRRRLIRRADDRRAATVAAACAAHASVPMLWSARLVPTRRAKAWLLLALAALTCRAFGWAHAAEAWRIAFPRRAAPPSDPEAVMRGTDALTRAAAASHPLPAECKERALTTWALGRMAGVPVELVVGVQPFPLQGHCWCTYNGVDYSDDPERCAQFKPVWRCS